MGFANISHRFGNGMQTVIMIDDCIFRIIDFTLKALDNTFSLSAILYSKFAIMEKLQDFIMM